MANKLIEKELLKKQIEMKQNELTSIAISKGVSSIEYMKVSQEINELLRKYYSL